MTNKKLEKAILRLVKNEPESLPRIIFRLRVEYPSVPIKAATQTIWRLVDRGVLALSPDRKIIEA